MELHITEEFDAITDRIEWTIRTEDEKAKTWLIEHAGLKQHNDGSFMVIDEAVDFLIRDFEAQGGIVNLYA